MPKPTIKPDFLTYYNDAELASVVGLTEAMLMFGVSRAELEKHIYQNKLSARKMFTGGMIIITIKSLVKLYGQPKQSILNKFYEGTNENAS